MGLRSLLGGGGGGVEDSAKGGGGGGAKGELNRRDIVKISENYNIEIKSNLTVFFVKFNL